MLTRQNYLESRSNSYELDLELSFVQTRKPSITRLGFTCDSLTGNHRLADCFAIESLAFIDVETKARYLDAPTFEVTLFEKIHYTFLSLTCLFQFETRRSASYYSLSIGVPSYIYILVSLSNLKPKL